MIKLMKSTFYREKETKEKLARFMMGAKILSMNKECKRFEEAFAKKQGSRFAVFTTSGSSANLVLIQALLNLGRLKKGDRVGFSSLTWSTNVMPIFQLGLVPVALDCELATLNVSPVELEKRIADISCLFLTNVLGFCGDIRTIKKMCKKNGVLLLEDNCESLGSKCGGVLLGNFGLASTFSFFVGHHLSTIEGGMICTDDPELHDMLLITRIHGWDRNLLPLKQRQLRKKHGVDDFYSKYIFYNLSFNARPTELNGFLGNAQIRYWDEIVSQRQRNFRLFQAAVEMNDDFIPLCLAHMELISNFAMPLVSKDKKTFEKYKKKFLQKSIEIRPIIAGNMIRQPFYKKHTEALEKCPNADFIHENGFYFPNNPELTDREVSTIISALKK